MPQRQRPHVVICDDHFITRRGLADLMTRHKIEVVAEAGTSEELLDAVQRAGNAVLILDLNLAGTNRLDLITLTARANPDLRIVVFSMWNSLETIIVAYRLGALAYVTKDSEPSYLIEAITHAANSQTYFMPGIEKEIALHVTKAVKSNPREVLTRQELRTFVLLAGGETNEVAAEQLGVTTKTIANQVSTIQKKLACDRRHFTNVALTYGLIGQDELVKPR